MNEGFPDLSGFLSQPRTVIDQAVLRHYEAFGLEPDDPLAVVQPFAELLFVRNQVPEAIGLVLGRNVTTKEIQSNRFLTDVAATGLEEPGYAFISLTLAMRDSPEKVAVRRPEFP